jgi:hypothetical protein
MSLVLVALTAFALLLILAQRQRPRSIALWALALAAGMWLLPGPAKVAAPLVVILTLAIGESLASLRTR